MEQLIERQNVLIKYISGFIENTNKSGKDKLTVGVLQARSELLREYFKKCCGYQENILETATKEDLTLTYFTADTYEKVELAYAENLGTLNDMMHSKQTKSSTLTNIDPKSNSSSEHSLPKIQLPRFGGELKEWTSFRDLFKSMVHANETLKCSQKFYYLKASLYGQAEQILRNITVNDLNYTVAWKLLCDRYDNKRLLVNSYLRSLMSLPAMKTESTEELKRLFDGTAEVIDALGSLERPVQHWDDWLIFITVQKLDHTTRKDWEVSISATDDLPVFKSLRSFLQSRVHMLDAITNNRTKDYSKVPLLKSLSTNVRLHAHHTFRKGKCPKCSQNHLLLFCPIFRQQTVLQRRDFVLKAHLCFNCLKSHHLQENCPSIGRCKHCNKSHHSMLHLPSNNTAIAEVPIPSVIPERANPGTSSDGKHSNKLSSTSTIALNSYQPKYNKLILLATARVILRSPCGRNIHVRALLDQSSQATFLSSSIADLLHLKRTRVNIPISGIGTVDAAVVKSLVEIEINSCVNPSFQLRTTALLLPSLTKLRSPSTFQIANWPHLVDLSLADPYLLDPTPPELIIGADNYGAILMEGIRKGSSTAQQTELGWVLSGPFDSSTEEGYTYKVTALCSSTEVSSNTDELLRKFWELEEVNVHPCPHSEEDQMVEKFYQQTVKRDESGRYIVRLPIRPSLKHVQFSGTRKAAFNTLIRMEHRFKQNDEFRRLYQDFLKEYSDLQHLEPINDDPNSLETGSCFFLPHHGVLKRDSATTKLRVVFNGSQKSPSGVSLNDYLAVGPKLQTDLRELILRWRKHAIVFAADIKMMFRQIKVDKKDLDLQRILWRESEEKPVRSFHLCTVTYGTGPAPFLAIRTLQQLAMDEKSLHPLGSKVVLEDFYVDDVLSGADDVSSALELQRQLTAILQSGGFTLHKWSSNRAELLLAVSQAKRKEKSTLTLSADDVIKTLGLLWHPESDYFSFKVTLTALSKQVTKRNLLADISRLYDPLGFLSPAVVLAKTLFQKLWLYKLSWDERLPPDLEKSWLSLREELHLLENVKVPRWIGCYSSCLSYELHGFSDASEMATAAVVYLRVCHNYGEYQVSLLSSKTKLAPIKQLSIPRLELVAAHLLAQLMERITTSMDFGQVPIYCWTDSQTVLVWLQSHPSKWKTFIANRVREIHRLVSKARWRFVPGISNPADCASRGVSPGKLANHDLWWTGPPWLTSHSTACPQNPIGQLLDISQLEEKPKPIIAAVADHDGTWDLATRFSSLDRLLRVTAYCIRFTRNARLPVGNRDDGPLGALELSTALLYWIRYSQSLDYHDELRRLRTEHPIHPSSSLLRLAPFLDKDTSTIRVGGRLHQSNLTQDAKHPFLLSKTSFLVPLIIKDAHEITLHGGAQLTTSYIRQRFWIVNGRDLVRYYIRRCMKCFRQRATAQNQLMGRLPSERVRPARAFLHTGLDNAGPILVKTSPGRGRSVSKAYIALFVCMSTKAVHIELVSDLTTNAFIAAYKRFTARRGLCSTIYSDNAATFVGANAELRRSFWLLQEQLPEEFTALLAKQNTTWFFIPPKAPNFGGLWEAGVKAVKHHLKRVIGETILTFEELYTFLSQTEACLNSRPLYPLSSDPTDLQARIPGHFLIGSPLVTVPEPSLVDVSLNRLNRWQLLHKLYESFWRRWSVEYLNNLQVRNKWTTSQVNLLPDQLVLVRDDKLPPAQWCLGRVTEVHKGADGLVRVASIKCRESIIKRPVSKLCPLPTKPDN